jgi:hypothetical protein
LKITRARHRLNHHGSALLGRRMLCSAQKDAASNQ